MSSVSWRSIFVHHISVGSFLLLMIILFGACTPTQTPAPTATLTPLPMPANLHGDITNDFIEYSSLDDELYGVRIWEYSKTSFSLKYPPDWETIWLSDSGIVGFLMASSVDAVLLAQDHEIASIMIMVGRGGFSR